MAELESVERLDAKLQELGINNLKVFPGGKWKDRSVSERADEVVKILEQVERGELITCDFAALEALSEQADEPEEPEDTPPPRRAA
jgi:hypothetical protein